MKPSLKSLEYYSWSNIKNYFDEKYKVNIEYDVKTSNNFYRFINQAWFGNMSDVMLEGIQDINFSEIKVCLATEKWQEEICDLFRFEFGDGWININFDS